MRCSVVMKCSNLRVVPSLGQSRRVAKIGLDVEMVDELVRTSLEPRIGEVLRG